MKIKFSSDLALGDEELKKINCCWVRALFSASDFSDYPPVVQFTMEMFYFGYFKTKVVKLIKHRNPKLSRWSWACGTSETEHVWHGTENIFDIWHRKTLQVLKHLINLLKLLNKIFLVEILKVSESQTLLSPNWV